MARSWNQLDEERLQATLGVSAQVSSGQIEECELRLRDVIRGSLIHLLGMIQYRLRLEPTATRTLAEEICDARDARAFKEWLKNPIPD